MDTREILLGKLIFRPKGQIWFQNFKDCCFEIFLIFHKYLTKNLFWGFSLWRHKSLDDYISAYLNEQFLISSNFRKRCLVLFENFSIKKTKTKKTENLHCQHFISKIRFSRFWWLQNFLFEKRFKSTEYPNDNVIEIRSN